MYICVYIYIYIWIAGMFYEVFVTFDIQCVNRTLRFCKCVALRNKRCVKFIHGFGEHT